MDEESLPPTDLVVPLTNTAIPPTITAPEVGPRELEFVVLSGDPNGALDVSWPVPSDVSGGLPDQLGGGKRGLPDLDRFERERPVANAYTITGLAADVCYKVRLRARYVGDAGD